jgi:Ca-activated chloride channel family protein
MFAGLRVRSLFLTTFVAVLVMGCTATPPPRDPSLDVSGTLATPLLLAGGERTVYAIVHIHAAAMDDRPRGPVNVALCIDTSGSMEGTAIDQARRAAVQMVGALKDGDRLAVVAFNTKTKIVLHSTELDDDVRADVTQKILALEAVGTTDLAGGLQAAVSEVRQNLDPGGINRVVLLGDGVPNHPESIEATARSAAESGIAISALGLGLDYDEVLIGKIAEAPTGASPT